MSWSLLLVLLACGSSSPPEAAVAPAPAPPVEAPAPAPPETSACDELRAGFEAESSEEAWQDVGNRVTDVLDAEGVEAFCKGLKGKTSEEILAALEAVEANPPE